MYDPRTGQFLSEDPLGFESGDPNLRRYVGNSPTNYTDPAGLDRIEAGNLQRLTQMEKRELGYTDMTTAPTYRVPVFYIDEAPYGTRWMFEESPPVQIGYYYPEAGYVERRPEDGLPSGMKHGYRVSLSALKESVDNHEWDAWFAEHHNDKMNNSASLQLHIDRGSRDAGFHDRVSEFQGAAEVLAHVDMAFYGIAAGLAQPSHSLAVSKSVVTGRRIFDKNSIWRMGPGDRGFAIEANLGGNLPKGFRTIDRFQNGIATSIKSVDLTTKTYQDTRVLSKTVRGFIDKVAAFKGGRSAANAFSIHDNQIKSRALELAIPPRFNERNAEGGIGCSSAIR